MNESRDREIDRKDRWRLNRSGELVAVREKGTKRETWMLLQVSEMKTVVKPLTSENCRGLFGKDTE